MLTDIQIAQSSKMLPIEEIGAKLGFAKEDLLQYGPHMAKISASAIKARKNNKKGKLILVSAITPTPAGEGKTTTAIGLADALNRTGRNAAVCIREPSLGPVFGIKGGAAGGGYAQVLPMENINLHFTGDMHAIDIANNLLASLIDNSIYFGNPLNIDPKRVTWHRSSGLSDRQLRSVIVGGGARGDGIMRPDVFDITAASEIMATFCMAEDLADLKKRLANIIVAYTYDKAPVTVGQLGAEGSLAALLKDAIQPNLVQTIEHTPAFVHGGPFANIAHGCNTRIATNLALTSADYVVTEAGFAADLGAEKFLDIKCRIAGLKPDAVVLVATIRALKFHGGVDKKSLAQPNMEALKEGCKNMMRHIDNIKNGFGLPVTVALNRFGDDTDEEVQYILDLCKSIGASAGLSTVFTDGGAGAIDLANTIAAQCDQPSELHFTYTDEMSPREKIEAVAKRIYRAGSVSFGKSALDTLKQIEKMGLNHLPVCIAKTQYSFSDNPALINAPEGFEITVRSMKVSAGAGFIVALTGDIMTMPGLPKVPAANNIDIDEDGNISGLF